MSAVLAELNLRAWGFGDILVAVIVFFAVVAIAYLIITKGFGMTIPAWLVQVFWIVIAAVVGILAIRIVLSL